MVGSWFYQRIISLRIPRQEAIEKKHGFLRVNEVGGGSFIELNHLRRIGGFNFFLFFPDPWGDDSQFDGSHIFFNWVGWNHQLVENLRRIVCFLLRPRLSIQHFSHPSKTNDMTIAGRNSRIWMSRWQWYYFLLKNSVDFPASHSLVFRESGTFRRFGSPLSREILEIWLLDLGWVPPHEHIIVWTCIYIYLYIKIRMFLGHVFHDEFFLRSWKGADELWKNRMS